MKVYGDFKDDNVIIIVADNFDAIQKQINYFCTEKDFELSGNLTSSNVGMQFEYIATLVKVKT